MLPALSKRLADADRGDRGANWWTKRKVHRLQHPIADVRRVLALKHAWGARNGRVLARIPAGERVTHCRGRGAPGRASWRPTAIGGGTQLLFEPDDFQRTW